MSSTPEAAPRPGAPPHPPAPAVVQGQRRRRPSGEAPPLPHALNASGKSWLVLAAIALAFATVISLNQRVGGAVDVWDHAVLDSVAELRTPWLTRVMKVIGLAGTGRFLQVVWLVNLALMIAWRRWRHLFIWVAVGLVVVNVGGFAIGVIGRPRPVGIEILGPWKGFAMPSLPVAVLASFLVSTLYANVPRGRLRDRGKVAVGVVLALVIGSRIYLAQDAPTDALAGFVIGVALPLAAFRFFAPNDVFPVTYRRGRTAHLDVTGQRGEAIVRALEEQLGLIAVEVEAFGLEGSGGSTPLRVKVKGDPDIYVFCKLYAINHLRADRWYKLARTLLYGRLEDEKPYNAVRRLVQYEDYVLRLLFDAGLPVPRPYGIVEITPEREYLLVMEFMENAKEIGEADIDESIIDQGLRVVRRMWESGLAHRDIKPANLLVRDGRLHVIDSAFAQIRPSPWRQAVDLGNMMLVLGLRTDARTVYERAKLQFSEQELAEAFAATTRGLTMPSQLRRMLRAQGRDLHAEFTSLLPYTLPRVKIQRWSIRRAGLTVIALLLGLVFVQIAIGLLTSPI
jgi:tRNA A-37 threonylcarbamoyl transferase component Bud32/membrane-associated phospholipid phosphatase